VPTKSRAGSLEHLQETVWEFYRHHGRSMPWRTEPSPYNVFISEIMLQQTQVSRVLDKFPQFLQAFPHWTALAAAPVAEVLRQWQGMGYNRRALWLQRSAQVVIGEHAGNLPDEVDVLRKLPGVGPNTAGSIAAFAYNLPTTFIETNIRRVFIHHCFAEVNEVTDAELRPLIADALDHEHPREWYYALMDYGAYLGKTVPNPNRISRHYARQSKFEGSDRQLRGAILRHLLQAGEAETEELIAAISPQGRDRVESIIAQLVQEGLIQQLASGRFGYK
jgi:A/G-specific adenine glycosylase